MSHDPKCRELAEHFLPRKASWRQKLALAERIQEAIEDWIAQENAVVITELSASDMDADVVIVPPEKRE